MRPPARATTRPSPTANGTPIDAGPTDLAGAGPATDGASPDLASGADLTTCGGMTQPCCPSGVTCNNSLPCVAGMCS